MTSAAWARPSLGGDKTQQSLNALIGESTRLQEQIWRKTREAGEDKVFEAKRGQIMRYVGKEENKGQIKIWSKRTDIVCHRLEHQKS